MRIYVSCKTVKKHRTEHASITSIPLLLILQETAILNKKMIHIWYVDMAKPEERALFRQLCPAKNSRRSRAEALSAAGKRIVRCFFARRGRVAVTFALSEQGKPFALGESLSFNISHSKNIVCAAFSKDAIGVDIEYIRAHTAGIACYFTQEERAFIESRADSRRAFFDIWTRKEAVLKAIGTGWRLGGAAVNTVPDCVMYEQARWHIQSFTLRGEYAGAVCSPRRADYTITELSAADLEPCLPDTSRSVTLLDE